MSTVPPNDKRPSDPSDPDESRTESSRTEPSSAEAAGDAATPDHADGERFVVSSQGEATNAGAGADAADPVFLEPVAAERPQGASADAEPERAASPEPAPASEPASESAPEPELPAEPEPLVEPEPYAPTPPPAVIIPPAVALPVTTAASTDAAPASLPEESPAPPVERDASAAETAILSPEVVVAPVVVAPVVQPETVQPETVQPETVQPAQPEATAAAPVEANAAPTTPPRRKGNRGIGVLLAVVGAVVFAAVYAAITALVYIVAGRSFDVLDYVASSAFIVPTATFLVAFVVTALVINRAGWWAWVLGSFVIALVTYFASSGVILLLADIMTLTPSQAEEIWISLLFSPPLIIALVVAREVSLWFGALIAARGRAVRSRNAEARAAYDRDEANASTAI